MLAASAVAPPTTGLTVATEMLVRRLDREGIANAVIDISRDIDPGNRAVKLARRALEVLAMPRRMRRQAKALRGRAPATLFYIQLGQSYNAMLRDLMLLRTARALGLRSIVHFHGSAFRTVGDRAPAPLRVPWARALATAARAIVLSEGLAGMFDGIIDRARVAVIPNGVPDELAQRAAARTERFAGDRPLRVLFLGNLIEAKGYATYLEAAARAHERGLPLAFELAGQITEWTPIDPEAFARQRGLDNLAYHGVVGGEAKLALYESADVFVLPSRNEGQPISLLEAMHFGLPIITCAVGGIPDLVHDGEHGVHVPFDAPDAILDALVRLHADPARYRRIAETNVLAARASYTETAHGDAMLALLDEVDQLGGYGGS